MNRRTFFNVVGASLALPAARLSASGRAEEQAAPPRGSAVLKANLVCGGPGNDHDFDLARRKLLDALYDAGGIRTEVWRNYADTAAIASGDLLVTYTSLVPADEAQSAAVRRFVERGGRWFVLHASNYVREGDRPPDALGSRFITHPAYGPFTVTVTRPSDPLVSGLGSSFQVEDELYVMDVASDIEVLLHARWGGRGVVGAPIPEADQPLMYRRQVGEGAVVYLALGHSNRRLDPPRAGSAALPDRHGSWDNPAFQEIVRRTIAWAARRE